MNGLQTTLEALRIFLCVTLCSGSSLGKKKVGIQAGYDWGHRGAMLDNFLKIISQVKRTLFTCTYVLSIGMLCTRGILLILLCTYYCPPGARQTTQSLFISTPSLNWNIKSSWEVCENPVWWWKALIYFMMQFQWVTTYVTEIKKTYFEIYTKQVSCPLAFLFWTSA